MVPNGAVIFDPDTRNVVQFPLLISFEALAARCFTGFNSQGNYVVRRGSAFRFLLSKFGLSAIGPVSVVVPRASKAALEVSFD